MSSPYSFLPLDLMNYAASIFSSRAGLVSSPIPLPPSVALSASSPNCYNTLLAVRANFDALCAAAEAATYVRNYIRRLI